MTLLNEAYRADPAAHFSVGGTATGRGYVSVPFANAVRRVYDNANLSIYSAQQCNARCPFCVEELRPLSRGGSLVQQKTIELDDNKYFARLEAVLRTLAPLRPSVSLTGGEVSIDPRLPRILRVVNAAQQRNEARKLTMTTNASGLLRPTDGGGTVLDHIVEEGVRHLNISRAHKDAVHNQRLMRFVDGSADEDVLPAVMANLIKRRGGPIPRVRLSCVLLRSGVHTLEQVEDYLSFAADLGVDNVIFRQLMQYDRATFLPNIVTRFCAQSAVPMRPLLEKLQQRSRWQFEKQVLGYYYYVEVYRFSSHNGPIDVCFEGADLAELERRKRVDDEDIVHELVFHPNASLTSTWQPYDAVLM